MSLDNLAIHDGCMTGLEFKWNLITGLDNTHILHILYCYLKAVIIQILNPVVTATSGRCFENLHVDALGITSGTSGQEKSKGCK